MADRVSGAPFDPKRPRSAAVNIGSMRIRNYGKVEDAAAIPDLAALQKRRYERFLQADTPPEEREPVGMEAVFREAFPIRSRNGELSLDYVSYQLDRPRYSPDECRKLKLTYGYPLRVLFRLTKDSPVEQEVYLGEAPAMVGSGEFIINGAERVVVAQLHRSPGVDFIEIGSSPTHKQHSCRIIPERGSWIELEVSPKDVLDARIDQGGKIPATLLLRAMSPDLSTNEDLIKRFYECEQLSVDAGQPLERIAGRRVVADIVDQASDEVILAAGQPIPLELAQLLVRSTLETVEVIAGDIDPLILNTLEHDPTSSHEEALLRLFLRSRPGAPASLDHARQAFHDRFFDPNRYRLGAVGRFRLNRKLGLDAPEDEQTLTPRDLIACIHYLFRLRRGEGEADDIDHLANRRLRTIDELAAEELRRGLARLRRSALERMETQNADNLTPRDLLNTRAVTAALEDFFGRSELSQVVDQTNPLAQLCNERRLSALGPGGLNRKRAGFEVRDVHTSHYGRICPIETPEGANIGLISYLSVFAQVDPYGFIITPYRRVAHGRVNGEVAYLRADEEERVAIATADAAGQDGRLAGGRVLARVEGEFAPVPADQVAFVDVSPKQAVGVSASLIPFLEHSDANRALMGSNMQRQSVPLLTTEPPIVATGFEAAVARNSGLVVKAQRAGRVTRVDADSIVIDEVDEYKLRKFEPLNEGSCLNQRPLVRRGDYVRAGQIIADGPATSQGELALGKNVLVAFMTWDGYNFEDAIIISERLVKEDRYTSVHLEVFEATAREVRVGESKIAPQEFTRDIPNVSEKALANLDEDGVVRVGAMVKPGDILVGKVSPKARMELSSEDKLLHAIFGRAGEDVRNESLVTPPNVEGVVVHTEVFERRLNISPEEERRRIQELEHARDAEVAQTFLAMLQRLETVLGERPRYAYSDAPVLAPEAEGDVWRVLAAEERFDPDNLAGVADAVKGQVEEIVSRYRARIDALRVQAESECRRIRFGDELPRGVLKMARVVVATKRTLGVGDKMAGRHGNKGVIARVVPEEDMPFLPDGQPVEMLLNPLGVPSRMNLGQIFETHLGWAAKALGLRAVTPIFASATESEIQASLEEAGLPSHGKSKLFDGRTGEPFEQEVTVGYIYMMKLHHLVDDKIHARATGPYSLVTQQPLGGKARAGGQRLGEMEVWAIEAYGAAFLLQELLTVKSDDVDGRTRMFEAMVKGRNVLQAGLPVSFEVLTTEIRGLGLNIEYRRNGRSRGEGRPRALAWRAASASSDSGVK